MVDSLGQEGNNMKTSISRDSNPQPASYQAGDLATGHRNQMAHLLILKLGEAFPVALVRVDEPVQAVDGRIGFPAFPGVIGVNTWTIDNITAADSKCTVPSRSTHTRLVGTHFDFFFFKAPHAQT